MKNLFKNVLYIGCISKNTDYQQRKLYMVDFFSPQQNNLKKDF